MRSAPENFWVATPISVTLEVRTEYLQATLGLDKHLEISKELIRECVTVPGCCCCMPLLHNHLMDSCKYVCKNTLLVVKGGCICTPLTPLKSATAQQQIRREKWKDGSQQKSNPCRALGLSRHQWPTTEPLPVAYHWAGVTRQPLPLTILRSSSCPKLWVQFLVTSAFSPSSFTPQNTKHVFTSNRDMMSKQKGYLFCIRDVGEHVTSTGLGTCKET